MYPSGAIEIRTRIPVVHKVFCVGQPIILGISGKQPFLIGYGVTVSLNIIVTGQAAVKSSNDV